MTRRIARIVALASGLGACAGPSAGGQSTPADDGGLGRLHVYEVPAERLATAQESAEAGWIQVSGTGTVDVPPDRATVAFAVETRAPGAAEAASDNAEAMEEVLEALRASELAGLRLETFGYALRPEYRSGNDVRSREIVAYVASNNVRATVEDVSAVGRVIDTAIGSGANRVAGISFFASDTEAARTEALADAVRIATAEARAIAGALGRELGPPLEIDSGSPRMPRPQAFEMSAAQARSATPVEAGDQTVTATVSIRFAIGPESGG